MLGRTTFALLLFTAGCRQLFGLQLQSESDASGDDSGSDGSMVGATCVGDSLELEGGQTLDCSWGCTTVNGPHCAELLPSGGGVTSADLQPETGLTDVSIAAMTIDDKGSISGPAGSVRAAGTGLISGIDFHVANGIAIYRFKDVMFTGSVLFAGTLPIALVAVGSIAIGAVTLDVRGQCLNGSAGPGGFAGGVGDRDGSGAGGGSGGGGALMQGGGGGGGGFGGSGGVGADPIGLDSNGGVANGDVAMTTLIGGGGGGGGATGGLGTDLAADGGGGGGALQLAANLAMTIGGSINAGGCGGQAGGSDDGEDNDGGGGGGAGGALLIEAPTITFDTATLAVNGGGGGGEGAGVGQKGQPSRVAAQGGMPDGGGGAAGAVLNGVRGATPGGGGGGAIGRIRFETRAGTVATNGAILSPALTDSPTTAVSAVAATQ